MEIFSKNYLIQVAKQCQPNNGPNGHSGVLVFCCANGRVVRDGLAAGLKIFGVDPYEGYHAWCRSEVENRGLLGKCVFQMRDGKIPFPDCSFDFVIANRLEHISDLDLALAEIHRVLTPGGQALAIFPHAGVIWEEHSNTLFTHWFSSRSSLRLAWVYLCKCLGDVVAPFIVDRRSLWCLGSDNHGRTRWEWSRFVLWYLDNCCFYRKQSEIDGVFARYFDVQRLDSSFIEFRRARSRGWRFVVPFPSGWGLNEHILNRLIGVTILATKGRCDRSTVLRRSNE